jgi:shikimate dehydrogenase
MSTAPHWRAAGPTDFAVVGSPVSHSLSPAVHSAAYAALGLEHRYTAVEVRPGELAEAVASLRAGGCLGVNVTVPLKEEAFRLYPSDDPASEASNTVDLRSGKAWNTDVPGLAADLAEEAPGLALVIGSGGGARAAVLALVRSGWRVASQSRRPGALDAWASRHGVPLSDARAGFHLVVNATSAGHSGAAPDVDFRVVEVGGLAYDLSYGPAAVPFLELAGRHGLRVRDGLGMLVEQAALAFENWLGVPAPREAMRRAAGCR